MISIHFPCMERDRTMTGFNMIGFISIRSSRMGETLLPPPWPCCAISIPSPRTGRDGDFLCLKLKTIKFQSTLPTRGETVVNVIILYPGGAFQSTLPIRGETAVGKRLAHKNQLFQSTLPIQGET